MYWYYKFPLIALGVIAGIGLTYLAWTHLPEGLKSRLPTQRTAPKQPDGEDVAPPVSPTGVGPERATPTVSPNVSRSAAATPSPNLAEQEKRLATAERQLARDKLLAARELARKILESPETQPFSPLWERAANVVSRVDTVLINTDAPAPEKVAYEIREGDTLSAIAKRFHTTVEGIQRSNKLDPTSAVIYPGDILHIYRGDWRITVKRSRFLLILYDDKHLFKLYPVGIGRQDRTPLGTFRIATKIREPAWTPPGRVIPYGDPENVLGTRWLGLEPIGDTDPTLRGYGIHGTWQPETVGTAASEGCIRMKNDSVNELFDIVPIGTPVLIEDE
ncbi:MAG: L,D-transpeptidase family protein [Kiritimatiellaeota bacterium]|nr:L,D-transpeptidase family protein [Kiritimatiellota bacterium]